MSAPFIALSFEQSSFPIGDCLACGVKGLLYLDAANQDADVFRCLQCNAIVSEPAGHAARRGVESMGYVFLERSRTSPKTAKRGGCGAKGVRGCGSGGCSSGSCGTGGGCSSGGCKT